MFSGQKNLLCFFAALMFLLGLMATAAHAQTVAQPLLAQTPPMGWNSWDSFGTTIQEKQVKANADWMAKNLKKYGWQYVVVDMEWFVKNPTAEGNSKSFQYSMDSYGRYTPPANRFPSAAHAGGFKPLADYVHSLGLKFGIHVLQGIPREAVAKNLPIEGSSYHAADAANTSGTCRWNFDNYDAKDNPAGQAYYDSVARLYASWGVDFVKVDCIAAGPYKGDEIRMFSEALHKTGRPIVLSLSPGPAPIDKVDELRKCAQMWRISTDVWDLWHNPKFFPEGLKEQFPRVAAWAHLSEPGHWPDADMLPLGYLGPAPGWGKPRETRFSHDEQKTFLTLWSMFRSPLMMGGNLPHSDAWTTSLLTNAEVIAVDQHSTGNHAAITSDNAVVWVAKPTSGKGNYVAVFNTADAPQTLQYTWTQLGLPKGRYKLRDLWEHKNTGVKDALSVTLPAHACVLYRAQMHR